MFQVSFLFPSIQSTITALLVGVFDVSTIIPQLIKVGLNRLAINYVNKSL